MSQLRQMLLFKNFFGPDNHVRISALGKQVLDDKVLASQIADAIIKHKVKLENGEEIAIPDGNGGILVSLSTATGDDSDKATGTND